MGIEPRKLRRRPQHQLHNAVMLGWTNTVQKLLENGADPDTPGKSGYTPLMIAVMWRRHEIAELLLNAGADVNAPRERGATALMMVHDGDDEMMTLLLARGANDGDRGESV